MDHIADGQFADAPMMSKRLIVCNRQILQSSPVHPISVHGTQRGRWAAGVFFEEALLSCLRQSDLLRIQQRGLLSTASSSNPFTNPIFESIPQGIDWSHADRLLVVLRFLRSDQFGDSIAAPMYRLYVSLNISRLEPEVL